MFMKVEPTVMLKQSNGYFMEHFSTGFLSCVEPVKRDH